MLASDSTELLNGQVPVMLLFEFLNIGKHSITVRGVCMCVLPGKGSLSVSMTSEHLAHVEANVCACATWS